MKTFVVAIDDAFSINSLAFLYPNFTDKNNNRYIIHDTPSITVNDNQVKTNFDLLITHCNSNFQYIDALDPKQCIVLKRPNKSVMQIIMKRWKNQYGPTSMMLVPTYFSTNKLLLDNQKSGFFGEEISGKIVIKPADGARGIGHIIIDTEKVSLEILMDDLMQSSMDFPVFVEKFKDVVEFHNGHENEAFEGLNLLRNGFITAQRIVEDIEDEYRIIVTEQSIGYVQKRTRRGNAFKQASGFNMFRDENDIINFSEISNVPSVKNEIQSLLAYLCKNISPILSIDLFTTKHGEWGIFEYSNQFGTSGPGPVRVAKILQEYIVSEFKKRGFHE